MNIEKAFHKNSDVVKWKRRIYSNGSSCERTYNEQGQEETYKDSGGYSFEYTYNEQGQVETFKNSNGYSFEYTYNEQWLTYKNSNGYYAIKGKYVTKEEFEAFVDDEIIELNGVKYKRI
jgi:YD repeat-containing protein